MIAPVDLKVLVVDDNPSNLYVVVMMLERLGLKPESAGNGQEAIAACLAGVYDLVFMDLEMPVIDGIRATMIIKSKIPRERTPRIVALTANATQVQKEICFEVGMGDFMAKPIKMDRLKEVLILSARTKAQSVIAQAS